MIALQERWLVCSFLHPSVLTLHVQELERLDVLMRETIDIDVEIKSHEQTLKDLHQQVVVGDEIVGQFSALQVALMN
jgi:hypothetical protein